jgi:hypothetical protein
MRAQWALAIALWVFVSTRAAAQPLSQGVILQEANGRQHHVNFKGVINENQVAGTAEADGSPYVVAGTVDDAGNIVGTVTLPDGTPLATFTLPPRSMNVTYTIAGQTATATLGDDSIATPAQGDRAALIESKIAAKAAARRAAAAASVR